MWCVFVGVGFNVLWVFIWDFDGVDFVLKFGDVVEMV